MQSYYFYQHPTAQHTYVQKQPIAEQEAEFIWVECSRDDVVNRAEHWQQDIYAATGLWMNERDGCLRFSFILPPGKAITLVIAP